MFAPGFGFVPGFHVLSKRTCTRAFTFGSTFAAHSEPLATAPPGLPASLCCAPWWQSEQSNPLLFTNPAAVPACLSCTTESTCAPETCVVFG